MQISSTKIYPDERKVQTDLLGDYLDTCSCFGMNCRFWCSQVSREKCRLNLDACRIERVGFCWVSWRGRRCHAVSCWSTLLPVSRVRRHRGGRLAGIDSGCHTADRAMTPEIAECLLASCLVIALLKIARGLRLENQMTGDVRFFSNESRLENAGWIF